MTLNSILVSEGGPRRWMIFAQFLSIGGVLTMGFMLFSLRCSISWMVGQDVDNSYA